MVDKKNPPLPQLKDPPEKWLAWSRTQPPPENVKPAPKPDHDRRKNR